MACRKFTSDFGLELQDLVPASSKNSEAILLQINVIEKYLASNSENSSRILETLKTIGSIPTLIQDHHIEQACCVFISVAHVLQPLIPIAGVAGKALFWFAAMMLRDKQCIGTLVEKSLEKVLTKHTDQELETEAKGTMKEFRRTLTVIDTAFELGPESVNQHELIFFTNSQVFKGIKLITKLQERIVNAVDSRVVEDVEKINDFFEHYTTVVSMRIYLLWMFETLVTKSASTSCFTAIVLKKIAETEQKEVVDFFKQFRSPQHKQALFFSHLDISSCPITKLFLNYHGIEIQNLTNLTNGVFTLIPQKWPTCYMSVSRFPPNLLVYARDGTKNKKCKFLFEPVKRGGNIFRIRSISSPTKHVFMGSFFKLCRCSEDH